MDVSCTERMGIGMLNSFLAAVAEPDVDDDDVADVADIDQG